MEKPKADPLVSILTPVYNGEKYLEECIESVLAQTYQNWEYLIVNNCSKDRTLEIAQHYADKDRRIQIFRNDEFVGAVKNHNIALSKISPESKYCKIVQADDWLFPECLKRMVGVAEANPSVGMVTSYRLRNQWVDCDGLPYPSTVVPGRDICRFILLGGPLVVGTMSHPLIPSDLIRKRMPFFNEDHLYADTESCFEVLVNADLGFVHQVLTFSRVHDEQISSSLRRHDSWVLANLDLVKRFGPTVLSQVEYKNCSAKALDTYYRALGKNFLKLRGKAFWDFHTKGLLELGYSFSLVRVALGAVLEVVRVLSEPFRVFARHLKPAPANHPPKNGT